MSLFLFASAAACLLSYVANHIQIYVQIYGQAIMWATSIRRGLSKDTQMLLELNALCRSYMRIGLLTEGDAAEYSRAMFNTCFFQLDKYDFLCKIHRNLMGENIRSPLTP